MSMGSRLKAARVNKGYKLRKAGLMSGVGFSTISKAERDVGEIGSQTLEKLAKCYDVTIDSLILDNAPSLRADAATVRRAVLLADLEAMYNALEGGTDEEICIAAILHTLIAAIVDDKVKELEERWVNPSIVRRGPEAINAVQAVVSSLAIAILEESRAKGHTITIPSLGISIPPDAAGERDGGG